MDRARKGAPEFIQELGHSFPVWSPHTAAVGHTRALAKQWRQTVRIETIAGLLGTQISDRAAVLGTRLRPCVGPEVGVQFGPLRGRCRAAYPSRPVRIIVG